MTYWDYMFVDWLLRKALELPWPLRWHRKLVKVWSHVQTRKLDLWFRLSQVRRAFRTPLWQETGGGERKKTMRELKAKAKNK